MVEPSTALPRARTPVRTCVGCRRAVPATELLRVARGSRAVSPAAVEIVADPRRRAAGRGAWIHPDAGCLALAVRRRAFGRALRIDGPVDIAPLERHLAQHHPPAVPATGANRRK